MAAKEKRSVIKTILKSAVCLLLALVLVVLGYVSYVLIDYYRLDDKLPLTVAESLTKELDRYAVTGKEYTLASWNVGFGAYSADYSFFLDGGKYSRAFSSDAVYRNVGGATALLGRLNADFLLIQEVDLKATRSYHINEVDMIKEAFHGMSSVFAQNFDSPYLFYPFSSPHGKSVAGLLTLSCVEISSALRRSLPIESGLTKFLDLDRCYSVTRIECENGKTLCLYNLHLSAYTTDGTIANDQLKMLVADMTDERNNGNYVICGGDFNKDLLGNSSEIFGVDGSDFPWTQPIPDGIIPDDFNLIACSNAPSCRNANIPYEDGVSFVLTVDGFIVSDNVEVTEAHVIDTDFTYSDHEPVVMKFILK